MERAWADRERWEEMGKEAHAKAKQLSASNPAAELLKTVESLVSS
jgi:hypothetical protein